MKRLIDLRAEYSSNDLNYFPGDRELRYKIFSPFFRDLYENKVIYYEKGLILIKLENIEITPAYFHATAIPYLRVEDKYYGSTHFPDQWEFGTSWERMCLGGSHLYAPYCSWSVWPEPGRVQAVELLLRNGLLNEALQLTRLEPED